MTPFPHHYEVHLTAGASGYGELSTPGVPNLSTAAPIEFDGPGNAWSPEHLLLASVESCFFLAVRGVARRTTVEVLSLELKTTGIVDRSDGVIRFSEIVLRPTITVSPGADRDQVTRILEKAERTCLVAASLSTPVRLGPVVIREATTNHRAA